MLGVYTLDTRSSLLDILWAVGINQLPHGGMRLINVLGAEVALCGTSIAHALGPGNVTAYSFAGLAVGDEKFAAYQDAAFPDKSFYRITSLNDTVPQQLKPSQGYYHGGTEYWISKEPDPSPSDIVVCKGQSDINCNAGAVKNGTSSPGVTSVCIKKSIRPGRWQMSLTLRMAGSRNVFLLAHPGQLYDRSGSGEGAECRD